MSQAGLVDELQIGLAPLLLGGGLAVEVYSSNMVDDLDRQVAELTERGVAIRAIETQPGRYRKAEATGPEGHTISFGQALRPGND